MNSKENDKKGKEPLQRAYRTYETAYPPPGEIVQFLVENDIINLSDVQTQIADMNFENYIRETHSHEIWQGNDGRWRTYIYDKDAPKKRKLVAKSSKKKLLEYLSEIYQEDPAISDSITLRNLFPLWLEHKKLLVTETTIPRIQCDWKKYYENDPIVDQPIGSLNKIQLESWIMHLIRDNELTKTAYYNVSMIIRQLFQFAFDSEIIENNPFLRVKKDLGKFFKKTQKPLDETQVYSNEEIAALEKLIWEDFSKKGRKVYRLAPLAVLFQFYTGLRVSEICALKYSDILPGHKLHVQRMLVRDLHEVRERTKGFEGERVIYLAEKARTIIKATQEFRKNNGITCSEYIFSETGTPFPERTINDYLERYCNRLNIPYRSSHKLRKTAVSSMVNSGISLNAVRAFAGHRDEETTLKYYTFDREQESVRNEQFEKALSYS